MRSGERVILHRIRRTARLTRFPARGGSRRKAQAAGTSVTWRGASAGFFWRIAGMAEAACVRCTDRRSHSSAGLQVAEARLRRWLAWAASRSLHDDGFNPAEARPCALDSHLSFLGSEATHHISEWTVVFDRIPGPSEWTVHVSPLLNGRPPRECVDWGFSRV
jgi:hypothetical protein